MRFGQTTVKAAREIKQILNHGIPQKSHPSRQNIQYLRVRAALSHISLESEGNSQMTGGMGANTFYRIKADCGQLESKKIMVSLVLCRFGHSIFEATSDT
jgi:hypothetical protein